jgi:hypothetical protein
LYDTLKYLNTFDLEQHRALFANKAKRSRYFIAYPAKVDRPEERGAQSELGARYFEGAAAGTIMIGERPSNEHFDRLFPSPDAVIPLPHDAQDVEDVITDLDRQPDRQDRIRRTNVVDALLRHDWVYRWETVLRIAGLEPLPALSKRKQRLSELAETMHGDDATDSVPYRTTSATLLNERSE